VLNASVPHPQIPHLSLTQVTALVGPAFTIAMLAAIESLLSAVVADGMIGGRHRSNMELVAQGVANIASPLFGGIPATGAIARTATNIKTGGRTPLAGITHSVTLLAILLLLGKWASMVPLASLAAILVMVAYHMSEWRAFAGLLKAPKSDIVVLILTFGLTVFVDLSVAVQVGIVVASLLFMKRMSDITQIEWLDEDEIEDPGSITQSGRRAVDVYEVNGPFFFGAADKVKEVMGGIGKPPKAFVLRMRHVPAIDATGLHALEQMAKKCRHDRTRFILSEVREQPRRAIEKSGLKIGEIVDTFDEALERLTPRSS